MEKQKKEIKISLRVFITCLVLIVIIMGVMGGYIYSINQNKLLERNQVAVDNSESQEQMSQNNTNAVNANNKNSQIIDNSLSNFDLSFLKFENEKENKIYSPLSIKYALSMLKEGANGTSKEQISNVIGNNYKFKKYNSNSNMSLANSMFIRDSYKDKVKQEFINTLKSKYDAEICFDSFNNAKSLNNWIKNKTFNIIPEVAQDDDVKTLDFALVNALAIDMEWEEKFLMIWEANTEYLHEKKEYAKYMYDGINVNCTENVSENNFNNGSSNIEVSGMHIEATINNYDIVNTLGEDNIKKIVGDEYRKFAKGQDYDEEHAGGDFPLSEDVTDEGISKDLNEFLPKYIDELNSNYHKSGRSTDFSLYVDDDVKVFAKDLKEYGNTKLQYIGIMPTKGDLNEFVTNTSSDKINKYIKNLKTINSKNFKEGVVTLIKGYIPKFKFEYNLDLMEDLKKHNITDVFDTKKADLSNMVEDNAYINSAIHKANIEFTQDGIKAAAATLLGGAGGADPFNYCFDVPIEEIDLTFDKPYMFLIRDKETGETWFAGTVYEPLLWENDLSKEYTGE